MRKKYLWKKAIQKSCNATEGIDSSFANYLIKSAKERPVPIVKSMFLKLDKDHICYILKCLHNTEKKIGNIKAYLLTALYNAPMTIQNYYTNLANCDLAPDNRQK